MVMVVPKTPAWRTTNLAHRHKTGVFPHCGVRIHRSFGVRQAEKAAGPFSPPSALTDVCREQHNTNQACSLRTTLGA